MSRQHITDDSSSNMWGYSPTADERSEILAWLSPLEPQIRHHDIQTRRVDGMGGWLLLSEEYQNWFGSIYGHRSDCAALFCYGGPGVGKTYICSLVMDTLRRAAEENAAVACFYFDIAAEEEQSPAAVLSSLLKQVVAGLEEVPERISRAFRDREKASGCQRLPLSEIVGFLQDISSSRCTFICIDALDECPSRHRLELLDLLNQLLQKSPSTRLFMTGRPDILGEVEGHLGGRAATRSITPIKNDITTFLRAKLKTGIVPDAMSESLEEEIIRNIPEAVPEIFALDFLSAETILKDTAIHRRQRFRINKNVLGLGGAYGGILGRIKAQGGEEARLVAAALMWISHSRRPLQVEEICHAVAIRIGSTDLDSDDIPSISTLVGCCRGLITIDQDTSTLKLIHFTLKEYLCVHPDLFDRAHSTMAETCLTYLNFQHVNNLSVGPPPDLRGTPFLEYSSLYWGAHMRMGPSDRAKEFALQLLEQFNSHISAKILWKSINEGLPLGCDPGDKPFSALHCSSYFGVPEIANTLIEMNKWDVNETDGAGVTPLIWAARYGHGEVVGLLLQKKDIQPDQQDEDYGRTALSWAAGNGHDEVVSLFLDPRFVNPARIGRRWGRVGLLPVWRGINPDSSSKSGRTPLSWAAENGHEGIVRLLLGRGDANPHSSDEFNQTPLSYAASVGHDGVVKLLVESPDIDPNLSDGGGLTPLSYAAKWGREDLVRRFLENSGVRPDLPDNNYRTPLSYAASTGHEGIVKLLLGRRDVNPNSLDRNGLPPLSYAAAGRHGGVVKQLVESRHIDPNLSDGDGLTPLSYAAKWGREDLVRRFLQHSGVKPDLPDNNHRTPLSYAASRGHEGVVELLLACGDVNPNSLDSNGRPPLSYAAAGGHEGVVKLLVESPNIHPNSSDSNGLTPLSYAAKWGREDLVQRFLENSDTNPDLADNNHRTPLSYAVSSGCEGVVGMLLGHGDVNPNSLDSVGRPLLSYAAAGGHGGVVKLLVESPNIDPNSSDSNGLTPLSYASQWGREALVQQHLRRWGVNPNIPDSSGRTPLSFAASRGHEGVVEILLGHGDINPNSSDGNGLTPLSYAAITGALGVVKLLLDSQGVNPNSLDSRGRTPLSFAAFRGHEGVLKVLLGREDVNPNSPDFKGQTPLSYATMMKREGVVKLLSDAPNSNSKPLETPNRSYLYLALLVIFSAFSASLEFPFFLLTLFLSVFSTLLFFRPSPL